MSPCGPKPKCPDIRDLIAIGGKAELNSDIAEVKRLDPKLTIGGQHHPV